MRRLFSPVRTMALLLVLAATLVPSSHLVLAKQAHFRGARSGAVRSASGTWNEYVWDARFMSLHPTPARAPQNGVAAFPLQTNMTALLTTTNAGGYLGNLTGKTMTATLSVGYSGRVTYGFEGSSMNACGAPANARLFISTDAGTYSPNTAGRNETAYWWSNPGNITLNTQRSGVTLSVPVAPGKWSDANGHLSSSSPYIAGFNRAVANVKQIGISFGGGCYFDVGIGVANGAGSFTLNSVSVQ